MTDELERMIQRHYQAKRDEKSYIRFVPAGKSPSGKTSIWTVHNKNDPTVDIGIIRWAGNWRKYVYEQHGDIYYDWNCLREIADFIEIATKEHKK